MPMDLRHLRFRLFERLLPPISRRARRRRMRAFLERMGVRPGMRVLDLGGHPEIWRLVETPLDVTILNLPGHVEKQEDLRHRMHYVEGDACDVIDFEPGQFDLVFSNSVIEHVGPEERQQGFAREVRRLGRSYWVQTPSKWFPVEAHSGMPLWWFYPDALREAFLRRWRPKRPDWTEYVADTRVLSRRGLAELFPESRLYVEYALGFPKSYVAYWNADDRS